MFFHMLTHTILILIIISFKELIINSSLTYCFNFRCIYFLLKNQTNVLFFYYDLKRVGRELLAIFFEGNYLCILPRWQSEECDKDYLTEIIFDDSPLTTTRCSSHAIISGTVPKKIVFFLMICIYLSPYFYI